MCCRNVVEPGDCFMLCTDGLTTVFSEDAIQIILEAEPPPTRCTPLIEAADDAGGIDNVTVVVMILDSKRNLNPGESCLLTDYDTATSGEF